MGKSYYTITEITDLGPFITKLVLPMAARVKADAVKPECFRVYVERKNKQGELLMLPKSWLERDAKKPSKGYCEVKDAYPSCLSGERREEGEFVTLEMKIKPFGISSPIAAPNEKNEFV